MPKRPSALAITPDDAIILCADKFGDVYSLPLLESPLLVEANTNTTPTDIKGELPPAQAKAKPPAASSRTVHTKKNLEALRNQLEVTRVVAEKKSLNFEHQLLLGHVSLLTDLACVSLRQVQSFPGGTRSYILTADRDEHIRVSRGIPQSHIIEGYCLGHTQFVSKIVIPYWRQRWLISGGGDDHLILWDWLEGAALHTVDLNVPHNQWLDTVRYSGMEDGASGELTEGGGATSGNFAVSGIWVLRNQGFSGDETEGEVLVALEG